MFKINGQHACKKDCEYLVKINYIKTNTENCSFVNIQNLMIVFRLRKVELYNNGNVQSHIKHDTTHTIETTLPVKLPCVTNNNNNLRHKTTH